MDVDWWSMAWIIGIFEGWSYVFIGFFAYLIIYEIDCEDSFLNYIVNYKELKQKQ